MESVALVIWITGLILTPWFLARDVMEAGSWKP